MDSKLSIPVVETIKKRQSVRTYKDEMISNSDREKLLEYINVVDNPFNVPVKIHIIDKNLNENGEKLGTYGTIKGAKTFLGLSVSNADMALVAAGYQFENFQNPMPETLAGDYAITLEMVHLTPSATNFQPWRVLKQEILMIFMKHINKMLLKKNL